MHLSRSILLASAVLMGTVAYSPATAQLPEPTTCVMTTDSTTVLTLTNGHLLSKSHKMQILLPLRIVEDVTVKQDTLLVSINSENSDRPLVLHPVERRAAVRFIEAFRDEKAQEQRRRY